MLVRRFWRQCDFPGTGYSGPPVDAFWVEATDDEAAALVLPRLSNEEATRSREHAEWSRRHVRDFCEGRPFCFLVARDLHVIAQHPAHYPIANLWNGYSPFRAMAPVECGALEELAGVQIPQDDAAPGSL